MRFVRKSLATAVALALPSLALAQGSTAIGQIVVESQPIAVGAGLMIQEEASKARSTATQAYLSTQIPTANPYQGIHLLPGVNAHSTDATGLFSGSLRVRGFNSDQMGFTVDGAPVNDSGNYAVYPQEYVDLENLEEIFVTQGATDLDAPHVGAVGGNIGVVSSNPAEQRRFRIAQTLGDKGLTRTFIRADSGRFNNQATRLYASYSKSMVEKWRGKGEADRDHVDAKVIHDLGRGSRLSASIAYNFAENHFYRNITKAQYETFGRSYDYDTTFPGRPTPIAGTAQNESGLTNYYNLQWNPFENYIATFKANLQLDDKTRLDIEPYYWYGDGSGGFGTTLNEANAFNPLVYGAAAKDLNGDGDTLDRVLVWRTSYTHTTRPGINLKLTHQLGNHRLSAGLWYERAEHRQTQPFVLVSADGKPLDLWANSNLVTGPNGKVLQGRDQFTISTGRQLYLEDQISLLADRLNLTLGLRLPELERHGKNYANNTTGNHFDYSVTTTYRETLPQAGVRYRLSQTNSVFANVAKNFRAPQNFVLYEVNQAARTRNLEAETSTNIDVGFRHQSDKLNFAGTLYWVDFRNRMALVRDPDGISRNYNAGDVRTKGFEIEVGAQVTPNWGLYGSLSYTDAKQKDNFTTTTAANVPVTLPTAGKTFVDSPKWMAGLALRHDAGHWFGGIQAKYTGKRYSTLMNDEEIDGFVTVDANLGYKLANTGMMRNARIQLNVVNLFDEKYLAQITSTQVNAVPYQGLAGSAPNYAPGAARFASLTFTADF